MDAHDLLRAVPSAIDPDTLKDLRATVQYEIERPLAHVVEDGQVSVVEGTVDTADVVIAADDRLLLDIYRGQVNPISAFMMGRLRVRGDVSLARRLIGAVDRKQLPAVD